MTTLDTPPGPSTGDGDRPADPRTGADRRTAILFVDDEDHVLAGLRAVLRRRLGRRHRLLFANGAREALDLLDRGPIDLVVTDAQMPQVNGIELLESIRRHHAGTLRYVLSGEAGQDLVLQSVPVTQRWLAKPCDSDELSAALDRALDHRRTDPALDPDSVLALADIDALPTPPRLYARMRALMADDDVTIDQVTELVASDPAVAAKVLQWANSALSARRPVSDLRSAVARLGLAPIAHLVLSAEVVRTFEPDQRIPGFPLDRLTAYCTTHRDLAARLADPADALDASVAALLGMTGLLLEATRLPERLEGAYRLAEERGIGLVEAERELHGRSHLDLGAHLLSIWGLPPDLVALTRAGGDGSPIGGPPPLPAVDAIRAARILTHRCLADSGIGTPHLGPIGPAVLDRIATWGIDLTDPEGIRP